MTLAQPLVTLKGLLAGFGGTVATHQLPVALVTAGLQTSAVPLALAKYCTPCEVIFMWDQHLARVGELSVITIETLCTFLELPWFNR